MTRIVFNGRRLISVEIDGVKQEITDELQQQHQPPKFLHRESKAMRFEAKQFDQWPIWAKALKWCSKPEDKGIGDVVARLIGNENSEQFKSWYKATFNKDCGCKGRQARWNRLYPLK